MLTGSSLSLSLSLLSLTVHKAIKLKEQAHQNCCQMFLKWINLDDFNTILSALPIDILFPGSSVFYKSCYVKYVVLV